VPAVYTGEKMKAYRQWLPGTSYEANASLGGSFVSNNIEDYYTTPHELGYAAFTKFDHDFIGKEALQAMEGKRHRKKVTFAWNPDDVTKVFRSMFEPGADNYKYIDIPLSNYASSSFDSIMSGGKVVGASMFSGYSYNERSMLSLGFVEEPHAKPGTQLTLLWGEENGGTKKTTVERHRQIEMRVTVGPTPYSRAVRETYPGGWRATAAE
jgi:vanillate/3-O-methylgallate O-demethylase